MATSPGRPGFWVGQPGLTGMSDEQIGAFAGQLARAGYGAIWLGSASADLRSAEPILSATGGLVYATGILTVWTEPAEQVVASCRRLSAYSDRVLAGIGAGHPERPDNKQYARPCASLVAYPGALAEIPAGHLALAAGPEGARASREARRGWAPVLHRARAHPAGQRPASEPAA